MRSMSDSLQNLARQMGKDNVSSRADLEAKLTPLLRLILKTGRGHPSLLQWVRLALPEVAPARRLNDRVDPEWTALLLARRLCLQMRRDVRAQRDTMGNRQTVVAC